MATTNAKKIPIHVQSSQNRILIKGGRVVNDDSIIDADVYIEDGMIKQVGPNLIVPGGGQVIDAKGQYVMPGGIDQHTHLNFEFMGTRTADDFYTGTRAAVAGGTTTVIDFVASAPGTSLVDAFHRHRRAASEQACCDYAFHMIVPRWIDGKTEAEMEALVREHGINSFKVFMAYKGELQVSDSEILKVLDASKKLGALTMVHAENGDLIDYLQKKLYALGVRGPEAHPQSRPDMVEAEAVKRCITLATQARSPVYIVHIMSKQAAEEVIRAKENINEVPVFGETLAAALGSDGSHYYNACWRHAAGHVLSPPLRNDKSTADYMANLLSIGALDTIGSDHCVFNADQKALGKDDFRKIPNGVNGVEERMMVSWQRTVQRGRMDPCRFVAVTSANSARIFNLYPRKGRIASGSDADVVVWGNQKPLVISASRHHSAVDFNIFEGFRAEYTPTVVISNGKVVVDESGQLHVSQGAGRYLPCAPYSTYVYQRLNEFERHNPPVKVDRSKVKVQQQLSKEQSVTVETVDSQKIANNGPPSPSASIVSSVSSGSTNVDGFHRIKTRSGVKNLQDSTFKLTGEQMDEEKMKRTNIKVHNPPGGRSQGLW